MKREGFLGIVLTGYVRSLKNDLVFSSQSGTKICKRNLIRAFAQALEKAEIKDFTFHCIRHAFATTTTS